MCMLLPLAPPYSLCTLVKRLLSFLNQKLVELDLVYMHEHDLWEFHRCKRFTSLNNHSTEQYMVRGRASLWILAGRKTSRAFLSSCVKFAFTFEGSFLFLLPLWQQCGTVMSDLSVIPDSVPSHSCVTINNRFIRSGLQSVRRDRDHLF